MKIEVHKLGMTYRGGVKALDDINLQIETGMFGLLGPNAAGKTTFLRILATLIKPTQGWAAIDGFHVTDRNNLWLIRQIIGYVPQELGFYPNLTVHEFLEYITVLKNIHDPGQRKQEIEKVIDWISLEGAVQQYIRDLSAGTKQRLGIAQALLGSPQVLIVDEPSSGLDPEERANFRNLLSSLAKDRIVVLSTHIVEDIAHSCDQMAVLENGRLRFFGSPKQLREAAEGLVWELRLSNGQEPDPDWRVAALQTENGYSIIHVIGKRPTEQAKAVPPSLEEAYLLLMAKELKEYNHE